MMQGMPQQGMSMQNPMMDQMRKKALMQQLMQQMAMGGVPGNRPGQPGMPPVTQGGGISGMNPQALMQLLMMLKQRGGMGQAQGAPNPLQMMQGR